jgi:starch phosphorylase
VVDAFRSKLFCPHEPDLFSWIYRTVLDENDSYCHLADLPAYLATQQAAGEAFKDQSSWTKRAILNVARIGGFSSDRTVAEYAREIWDIKSL